MRKRDRPRLIVEFEIEQLGPKGVGEGEAPDGRRARVRRAAPGTRVLAHLHTRKEGIWVGRHLATIRPAADGAVPPCPKFGVCGGCTLQELSIEAQRRHKLDLCLREIARGAAGVEGAGEVLAGATVHPGRGISRAFRYRNKIELGFAPKRYLTDEEMALGADNNGRFMGFHAPERFDRVVDVDDCVLASEAMRDLLRIVRGRALADGAAPPWNSRTNTGFYRNIVLREAQATGELLIGLITRTPEGDAEEAELRALAEALMSASLPGDAQVAGVTWLTNDGVAEVARGDLRAQWGRDHVEERLGPLTWKLSLASFFQTSLEGATLLYDTVAEALGASGGTLLDLYCGTGTIGCYLAPRFDRVWGIDEVADAVADANENARRNGITHAEFRAGRVEDALAALPAGEVAIVVDPPRVGLHPKVSAALASSAAREIVYVACHPASLGRDAAILANGGFRLREVWMVDLFPQTGHVEVVGRFTR